MAMLEKLKESYKKLSNEFAYFYTNGMHYEEDGDEIYELKFEWFGLGDPDSFTYIFGIDGDPCGDEVQMAHKELWYYSVAQLGAISDFVKLFNEARADRETVLKFIDYLEEHKEEK